MKKSIFLSFLTVCALTACDSDSDRVFDQSAADRLEQYKQEYAEVLTAEGGLWTMEYFSNDEEPGYVFIMKFDKDGSVKVGANHKWIGNAYKEETSLWKMIADNGPVLSFNSYNTLFHIFSDPANITGSEAPKGETDEDINETGYGHNGDYEFQVMEVSDDSNSIRLLGKKRLYDIYLRRLDASTDMQAYMDEYKQIESTLFAKEIPNLKFVDADGDVFMVNGCHTGVMSVYPENGDAVDQTRSANFIVTTSGIRFMQPLEYVNAAGQEKSVSEFRFVGNHALTLNEAENTLLSAGTFEEIMMRNLRNWKIDLKSLEGSMKNDMDSLINELRTLYNYKSATVQDMSFDYDAALSSYVLKVYVRISSKGYETYRYIVDFSDQDGKVRMAVGEPTDTNSTLALNAYSQLQAIFSVLNESRFSYSTRSDCGPNRIVLSVDDGSMTVNAL